MQLELIERHVYHIKDATVARAVSQALNADDLERLDELIDFIVDVGDASTYSSEMLSAEMVPTTKAARRRKGVA